MWTPEKIKRLEVLSKEGLSSGAIADRLGVTRNAALRKLYSTGLWVPGDRRPKQKVPRSPARLEAPEARNLTILEVRDSECKYAVITGQKGDHRFCGAPVQPGSPYCAFHHKACSGGPGGRL